MNGKSSFTFSLSCLHKALNTSPFALYSLESRHLSSSLSSSTSFYGFTSGRARRRGARLQRYLRYQKTQAKDGRIGLLKQTHSGKHLSAEEDEDTRTVQDILLPNPFKNDPPDPRDTEPPWPKTYSGWKSLLSRAWKMYCWTWQGFWTSRGMFVETQEEIKEQQDTIDSTKKEIVDRVKQNANIVKEGALSLRTQVRDYTGIHSHEDLRKWAAEMMRVAADCLNEFMAGYRNGRDDEVEKMLTQYFQELQKEVKKPRKRRKKRRILNKWHALVR